MLEDDAVGEAQVAHAVGRDPALDLVGHRPAGEQRGEREVGARELVTDRRSRTAIQPWLCICYRSTTMVVEEEFITIAHRIVWCGVATVDRRGRPRTRILHPILGARRRRRCAAGSSTRKSPLKAAHLAHAPYVSCTYWDADARRRDRRLPRRLGGGPRRARAGLGALRRARPSRSATTSTRSGPTAPGADGAALLRLDPWRLHVADAMTVTTPRVRRAGTEYR